MADINQTITLGIGTPAGIPEFLTFGLQIGAAAALYALAGDVAIRLIADSNANMRFTAAGDVATRFTAEGDTEL